MKNFLLFSWLCSAAAAEADLKEANLLRAGQTEVGRGLRKNAKHSLLNSRLGRIKRNSKKTGKKPHQIAFFEESVETKSEMSVQSWSTLGVIHKTEYWGTIRVGEEEFTVIFDTGSGNLILPGQECESEACLQHKKYDVSKSSSGMQVGKDGKSLTEDPTQRKDATVRFGTGEIHGEFVQEKICLGATGDACATASFIATDTESDQPFSQCQFDGIMGLGFKDLSMGPGFNMIDEFSASRSLGKNQFSVFLSDDGVSEINFGGYKPSQAASEVFWVPVNLESYWQIAIDDIAFDNVPKGLCENCQVAVDTGTSLLAGPSDVIEKLGSELNLKDDCSNFNELPYLGFVVNGKVLNLTPDDYVDKGPDGCSLALMSLDVPPPKGPIFVFGDPFLRRFLTIYDRDGPNVGFAVAKQGTTDVSSLLAEVKSGGVAPKPVQQKTEEETAQHDLKEEAEAETALKSIVDDWVVKGEGFLQVATKAKEGELISVELTRTRREA